MVKDPLEKWRKPGGRTEHAGPRHEPEVEQARAPLGNGEIAGNADAEHEKDPTRFRLHCLELRPLKGLWSLPPYAELIDVLFDGRNPSFIALVFVHQLVIIKGRNLSSIVAGLRMRTQWVIEQYDAEKNGPAEKNAAVVLSMEFFYKDIPMMVAELRGNKSPLRNP